MIYLATPYTHPDLNVRIARYQRAVEACAILARHKLVVYSPIVHWHPVEISHPGFEMDHEFWKFNDHAMMDLASEGVFLQLDGWATSKGMAHEVEYLRSQNKPAISIPLEFLGEYAEHCARNLEKQK